MKLYNRQLLRKSEERKKRKEEPLPLANRRHIFPRRRHK